MHQKPIKMKPETFQMASWARVGSWIMKKRLHLSAGARFFVEKCDFGCHFRSLVYFQGGPKITFLAVILEKMRKKGLEAVPEKTLNFDGFLMPK